MLLNRASERNVASTEKLIAEKHRVSSATEVVSINCDLQSFQSVRSAAEKINELCKSHGGLNILANNAGISSAKDLRTADGYEVQMQTNHFSHFLLTKLLMPSFLLAYTAGKEVRVCQHSSERRMGKAPNEKNYSLTEAGSLCGDGVAASSERYHQTKLANALFAIMFHKKLVESELDTNRFKSVLAEPGVADTSIISGEMRNRDTYLEWLSVHLVTLLVRLLRPVQGAADGALPLIHACLAEDVSSGDFFLPHKIHYGNPFRALHKGVLTPKHTLPEKETLNEKYQKFVWEKSVQVCGDIFDKAVA